MRSRRKQGETSRHIATEAARLMASTGLADIAAARRKAAQRLGCKDSRQWPDHNEVAAALQEYQQLFLSDRQPEALKNLRQLALQAMRDLAAFRPKLVGPVLEGVADTHSGIRLILYADTPEDVAFTLTDRHIPYREGDLRLCFSGDRQLPRPAFSFMAGETTIELVVLSPADRNDPPLDPDSRLPVKGASTQAVQKLLETADQR